MGPGEEAGVDEVEAEPVVEVRPITSISSHPPTPVKAKIKAKIKARSLIRRAQSMLTFPPMLPGPVRSTGRKAEALLIVATL